MLGANQLRVLTILQPSAEWLISGHKTFETRSWPTLYRGWVVIHAGAVPGPFKKGYQGEMALGVALGLAYLTDCKTCGYWKANTDLVTPREESIGHWEDANFAWLMGKRIRFPRPIPHKGGLRLRKPTPQLIEAANLAIHNLGR